MPDKDNQPLLEEETVQPDPLVALVQRLEAAEAQLAQPNPLNDVVNSLHHRLSAVEQALTHLAGGSMQLQLGAPELEAIGTALRGHMTQAIFDVLKTHYGLNPPVVR